MGQAVSRGNPRFGALRLVDDDSEDTRELVKLYMLEAPPRWCATASCLWWREWATGWSRLRRIEG